MKQNLVNLPIEIIDNIFKFIPAAERYKLCRTNSAFSSYCDARNIKPIPAMRFPKQHEIIVSDYIEQSATNDAGYHDYYTVPITSKKGRERIGYFFPEELELLPPAKRKDKKRFANMKVSAIQIMGMNTSPLADWVKWNEIKTLNQLKTVINNVRKQVKPIVSKRLVYGATNN